MCRAQELGSYAQGQGHNQVKGQIVPKIVRAHDLGSYAQGQGRSQVRGQNLVSAITQKLLKQI